MIDSGERRQSVIRRFESAGEVSTQVEIDEDGFATVRVAHAACAAPVEYASGPLYIEAGEIECPRCGAPLLTYAGGDGERVGDASTL